MTSVDLASSAVAGESRRFEWAWVALAWLVMAVFQIASKFAGLAENGPTDPDSMMRLVQVRDFLAGAAWNDLIQPRVNPPEGLMMHWSRFVDFPLATLLGSLSGPFSLQTAETILLALWPMLLYGPYLFAAVMLARRLVGAAGTLPAMAFAVFAAPCFAQFMPGNIDHHNVQIVLYAGMMVALLGVDRAPVHAIGAGFLSAFMLTVGLETLPVVSVACVGLALAWMVDPDRYGRAARMFGVTFALAMVAQRIATMPSHEWLTSRCDVASFPYILLGVFGGVGLAALTTARLETVPHRFAGLVALGAILIFVLTVAGRDCLSGPYGELDPRLIPLWLDNIAEARNVVQMLRDAPLEAAAFFLGPTIALGVAIVALTRADPDQRIAWALLVASLAVALAAAAWQIRAITFASLLAIPPLAYLVVQMRQVGETKTPRVAAAILVAAYVLPNQYLHGLARVAIERMAWLNQPAALVAASISNDASLSNCAARPNYAALAALPRGIAMQPSNLGSPILLNTPHSVISAPYHRNAEGILDGFDTFRGSFAEARAIIKRRNAEYVVVCPIDDETDIIRRTAPGGFLDRLLNGERPDWLEPIATGKSALLVWHVLDRPMATPKPRKPVKRSLADLRGRL
jgi:hypothetical protein